MATLIKTSGEEQIITLKNGKYFQLEELQEAVEGYIEIIQLSSRRIMVVNEEGHLLHLDPNIKATNIINKIQSKSPTLFMVGLILGNVLICKPSEIKWSHSSIPMPK